MGISVGIRRFLIFGVFLAVIVVSQCYYFLFDAHKNSVDFPVEVVSVTENVIKGVPNVKFSSDSKDYAYEKESELESDEGRNSREGDSVVKGFNLESHEDATQSFTQKRPMFVQGTEQKGRELDNRLNIQQAENDTLFDSKGISSNRVKILDEDLRPSDLLLAVKKPSNGSGIQTVQMGHQNEKPQLLKTATSSLRSRLRWSSSITQMNSLLLQSFNSSSMKPRWYSRPDRELLSAKLVIENARVNSNSSGLYAPIFRDVSKFSRSYELMERKLKVYIYREGAKPIFHQPKMRGIYASEGWFMKLMEGNKKFTVRDPRKAHLFYLPFSSQMLRTTLSDRKQMEQHLERYVELIAGKYRFWNRTQGADHFLIACHDWAFQITRQPMKGCIRSLCNSNVAKGFQIGKDTTLPVTYIHSVMDPLREFLGKPPSERSILAFFAGSMHGYLRPILLKFWENKEPDMKILGPMPRDIEGKRMYMEYMNSSKYCICARGYEVHTPRIIESIVSECVPVIISDNYVPPLFEVLNWEAFSVFVRESDVPSLRNLLLSIPEEKYLALHLGVKKVKQHFTWHKDPVKYDLFHMILHSVWNNRLSQIRPR